MPEYSYIEAALTRNNYGAIDSITYKWVGKSPYVRVSLEFIRQIYGLRDDISKIQIGPYALMMVEDNHADMSILYVRKDRLGALRVFMYKSSRWLDLIYRRIIITLSVWNLAEYHSYAIPSYKDIKIFKRTERKQHA